MTLRPDADLAGVHRSHARLLASVAGIDDDVARRPSLLPGWDVAMLVTHLARNADSHVRAAEGARVGERRPRYVDGERDAGIEAGRGRSAAALVDDLTAAIERWETTLTSLPAEAWSMVNDDDEPIADLPRYRWREVELHHADLGLGFTPDDWDEAFVGEELAMWVPLLDERLPGGALVMATDTGAIWRVGDASIEVAAPARTLLAWVSGRRTDGLPALGPWQW